MSILQKKQPQSFALHGLQRWQALPNTYTTLAFRCCGGFSYAGAAAVACAAAAAASAHLTGDAPTAVRLCQALLARYDTAAASANSSVNQSSGKQLSSTDTAGKNQATDLVSSGYWAALITALCIGGLTADVSLAQVRYVLPNYALPSAQRTRVQSHISVLCCDQR